MGQREPVKLVILSAGSGVTGSSTVDAGNDTSSSLPERTVQAPSPTKPASSPEGSSVTDDELGIIVGGSLMVVVMLSILIIGHQRRRRMKKDAALEPSPGTLEASTRRSPANNAPGMYVLDNNSYLSSSISFGSRASCFLQAESEDCESWNHPVVLAVRVSVNEISLDELVARGTNSEVYRGQYRDQVVAIKPLRSGSETAKCRCLLRAGEDVDVSGVDTPWHRVVPLCVVEIARVCVYGV